MTSREVDTPDQSTMREASKQLKDSIVSETASERDEIKVVQEERDPEEVKVEAVDSHGLVTLKARWQR